MNFFKNRIKIDISPKPGDLYVFYSGQEFPVMDDFIKFIQPTGDEQKFLQDKITDLANKQ